MIKILRIILFPISILYGIAIFARNLFYDWGLLHSKRFDIPVISVGNLVVGGTGKTPMTEYLVKLLKDEQKIATLSRGYGRKTKGFIVASSGTKSHLIGDEPKQYKYKFPGIIVAVGENRGEAIDALMSNYHVEGIILDDAFQHRSVIAGLSILLFDYKDIYKMDFMLPTGNLREWKSGKKRADVFVVTKCPPDLPADERERIKKILNPNSNQTVYFAFIKYDDLKLYDADSHSSNSNKVILIDDLKQYIIVLVSGIANPQPLIKYLQPLTKDGLALNFKDHYIYDELDLEMIKSKSDYIKDSNKIFLTTEKDLMRLTDLSPDTLALLQPLYCIPISTRFFDEDGNKFEEQILNYVRKNKTNG
jgi:tetraacyldisaccharide 4'-kinase